jgi:hypothetical protein
MSDDAIIDILRRAPLSFIGTIENLGAATMDVPTDDRTAVVYVDRILHGPQSLAGLGGQRITLQLDAHAHSPRVGDTAAFFAQILAIGDSAAVAEIGRLPLAVVEPHMRHAASAGEHAFASLERQIEASSLRKCAHEADALVLASVVKLEKMQLSGVRMLSEHDPDWWVATLHVYHVERGDVKEGEVAVRYANSLDTRWRDAPKPKPSESALWLLHRSHGEMAKIAPFEILHAEDRQPEQSLDIIREHRSYR